MRRPLAALALGAAIAGLAVPAAGVAETGPTPGGQGLDARFGNCGVLKPKITTPSRFTSRASRLARDPDGMFVAAGTGSGTSDPDDPFTFMLARFSADGAPDPSFGSGGGTATVIPRPADAQDAELTGLLVQPDRKIVVSGFVRLADPNFRQAYLARYNADGTLDSSFGDGGIVKDALPAVHGGSIEDVALAPDGAIIAAGSRNASPASDPDAVGQDHFVVARYKGSDGTLDPAFGEAGVRELDPGFGGSFADDVDVLVDGRILAAGQAGEQFMVVRLLPTGTPDPSFGSGGMALDSPPASAAVTSLTPLPDGRLQVVGSASNINGRDQIALGRYTADGKPDPTFGDDGFRIDRKGLAPSSVALAPDGKLVVSGGAIQPRFSSGLGVVRYDADGTRDTSFGIRGALVGFDNFGFEAGDVLLQPDGTALVATDANGQFAVARYAVDEPALAATADQARVCSVYSTTKTLKQLLRPGKKLPRGKLLIGLRLRQPGGVRVTASVKARGRTATLGKVTLYRSLFGKNVGQIPVSKKAARLLRGAKSAVVTLTARGVDGGDAATATKTLKRR